MKTILLLASCIMVGGCISPVVQPPASSKPPLPSKVIRKAATVKDLTVTPSVTLAWNASTSADVAGYRIYAGPASGIYTNSFPVGNALAYTVSNLVAGSTLFFAATAVSTNGLESVFSNEVSYTVPTNSPGNLLISAQYSSAPDGPWLTFTNWTTPNTGSNAFFRLQISPTP